MLGWGMRAACAALVMAWVGVATPVRAVDLDLERASIEIDFEQSMSVLKNTSVAITTVPARAWSCEWIDDSGVQCTTDSPLPLATRVRVRLPALMRADGRMQPALDLYGDTDRPGLYRHTDVTWVDGVPVLILTSDHRITVDTALKHLRVEAGGREWPVAGLEDVTRHGRAGESPTRFRVILPRDLPDDTVVTLRSTAGLRSEDGPLVRDAADEIDRFHYRESFRVRAVWCPHQGARAEAKPEASAVALHCNSDGAVRIALSDTLDDASVDALREALPAGIVLTRQTGVSYWGDAQGGRRIERVRGDELVLDGALTPGVDLRVVLGAHLRDVRGRSIAPTTLVVSPGPPTPVVHAASGSRLIVDPERSGELEVINGPQVVAAALGLGERPVMTEADTPSTRGTRASITRADTRRVLAEGGSVVWAIGHSRERIELAAPQFDLAIVTTPGRTVLAWAHEWDTARPLAGARVELGVLSSNGEWRTVTEAVTDADGIARMVIAPEDVEPRQNRGDPSLAWMVRATHGGRRAVRPVASRSAWWATSRSDDEDMSDVRRLFVVTDRPLYGAGDTLRLHGWVRDVPGGRLLTRAVEPFELALRTSRDDASAVADALVEPKADGSFSAEIRLPEHMVDGDYCFEVPEWDIELDACVFVGTFRAQDLWGEASLSGGLLREGAPVTLTLQAGYLSGGPASSVQVLNANVSLRPASPADAFPEFKDFAFGEQDAEGVWLEPSKPELAGVRLDAEGRAAIQWPLTVTVGGRPGKVRYTFARLQASAILGIEGGEATAVNTEPAWVSSADAFVGLQLTPAWPSHSSPIKATAVVIDRDGQKQPGDAVTLSVTRRDFDGDGAAEAVATCTLVPGIETPCNVPRQRSGVYLFTASRKGAEDVVLERYIHVSGFATAERLQGGLSVAVAPAAHDAPMRLALDHPFAQADALLVISSGDEVLHARRMQVQGGRSWLDLPTYANRRAGVDVQVLVRERVPRAASADGTREAPRYVDASVYVNVPLPPPSRSVEVRFTPVAGRPGAPVQLVVRNRAATPRTVTLAVFDDALRQLAGDRWDAFDPRGDAWLSHVPASRAGGSLWHFGGFATDRRVTLFWPSGAAGDPAPRGWSSNDLGSVGDVLFNISSADGGALVSEELDRITVTGSRLATPAPAPVMALGRGDVERDGFMAVADVIDVAPAHGPGRRPDREANAPATGRGPAVDRSAFGARVRNAFLQTVLWEPSVTLQPGEERVFTLTLPDNLTRWHAAAWSVSGDDDFTLDTAQIEVGLPVEVRLLAPARLYPGDRARLIGNVRHTGDAATAETALWTEGVEADATSQVPLVASGQAAFTLQVAPTDADQARTGALRAVAAARVNGIADAVSRSITLASPRIRATRVQAGWLGRRPVRLDLPALPRTAEDAMLQVTLLPGADALVHDWIDDLHRYPHRCWEQILSRALAAAIALERGDGDRFPDAKGAIDEALRNIPVFQDYRGDFRYFADDTVTYNGDPVLTAYSVRALRLLSTLGYDVPLKAISEADGYLNLAHGWLEDTPDDHARLAYVAAGQERPRRDLTDTLWSAFDTLPLHAQVAAVSAMADGQHPQASAAVQRLMKRAPLRGESRVLQARERSDRWMGSDLREQCALLDVLYRHPALVSEADRRALVMGLGSLYAGGIGDVDTQTGAVCLVALRALPKAESSGVTLEVAHGDARATLALADGAPRTFTSPASVGGAVQLRGNVPGEAPASYRVEVQYTEDAREATSTAIGFALERRHAVLRDGQWVPVQGQQVREGDWVRVTLVVRTGAERHFVALTDDVPGGLQPTDLTLSGVAGLDLQAVSSTGSAWFGTRRLDPMAPKFYARYLPEGTHEVHYFARVGNAGDYLAAPAQAELMYGAATRARTGAQRLEFLPQE